MKKRIIALFLASVVALLQSAVYVNAEENGSEAMQAETAEVSEGTAPAAEDYKEAELGIFSEDRDNIYEPHTIPDYWEIGYKNEYKIDKNANYIQATSAVSYSGNNSLEICYPLGDMGDGTAVYLRNYSVSGLGPADYELSFAVKEASRTPLCVRLESQSKVASRELKWPIGNTRTDLGNGWYKYTMTFAASEISGELVQLYFEQFDKISSPIFVDNIVFAKKGETENLITNGDFEEVYIPSVIDKYEPSNVMVSVRNKMILTPSWTNPQTDAEAVRLYDITDGKNLLLSESFAAGAGKRNHFKYENLTPDKEYSFRIEFDFGDKGIKEFYTYGATNAVYNTFQTGGWATNFGFGAEHGYTPVWAGIDTQEKRSGNGSMRIKSNLDGESGLMLELNIDFNNKLVQSKRYLVSFWAKGKNVSGNALFLRMENSHIMSLGAVTEEWKQLSAVYDTTPTPIDVPSTSGCLKFWVNNAIGDLWLDDIEVYELDENNNIVGDNLVSDPDVAGFEKDADAAVPPAIKNLSAEPLSRSAVLAWTNPISSSVDHINVYEVIDGEYALRAVVPPTASEITLKNLDNEHTYTYVLRTVSKFGVESQTVETDVTPQTPETEILELSLNNGQEMLSIGKNIFKVDVLNNFKPEPLEAELIVALYKNDGKEMVDIAVDPVKLNAGDKSTLTAEIDVPGKEYTVSVFIWNKLFGLDTLRKVRTFTTE